MGADSSPDLSGLKIIHCFRAPVGGLFRHVCDLVAAQVEAGAMVGVICERMKGDALSDLRLERLETMCALGLHSVTMGRFPGVSDLATLSAIGGLVEDLHPHVLHGHGAKGGAYVRLLPRRVPARRIYTPHGGALHYPRVSPAGFVFHGLERLLAARTDGILFESEFGLNAYTRHVGPCQARHAVVHNGVRAEEFRPVAPAAHAADFVYLGEMRELKGVSTLLQAFRALTRRRSATLALIGNGPDLGRFQAEAEKLGIAQAISWHKPMAAREAFALGRCLVMPSYKESLPYVALEAAAAAMPFLATRAGGLPEIFGGQAEALLPPGEPAVLARAMERFLADPEGAGQAARRLSAHVEESFSLKSMSAGVAHMYLAALQGREAVRRQPVSPLQTGANG